MISHLRKNLLRVSPLRRSLCTRVSVLSDVKEEERGISSFEKPDPVEEKPLSSLGITTRINKISKIGSMSIDMFAGEYDTDLLTYPECLDNRKESAHVYEQSKMVNQLWPKIWNDPERLQQFNFHNLYELSVTEMMTIFEAIGKTSLVTQDANANQLVTKSIFSLIIRNCMTYYPLLMSENQDLKNRLIPYPAIDFFNRSHKGVLQPIGLAYSERAPYFGSLPPQEWSTVGARDEVSKTWLINGKKTRILLEEGVDNYLVFFRDEVLAKKVGSKPKDREPNPASDPLTGACIVPKDKLKSISPEYCDSAGLKYVDIELNTLISQDYEVFPSKRKSPWSLNIKGLGQLGTSAVVLGMLKDALRETYKFVLDNKRGLLDCDIVRTKLSDSTNKIFAIESLVYFVSGMYDGLESGFDAHIEAAITKILAIEYGYDILRNLQQVCGSDMFLTSRLQDQLNIMDSFMDGSLHNRIYVATMGVLWFSRKKHVHLSKMRLAPWYPGYFTRMMFKESIERYDLLTLDADVKGNLHPRLEGPGMRLEYIVKRLKHATDMLCKRHGMDVLSKQKDLIRLSQLAVDSFMLTAVLARSSRSFCAGTKNGELETITAEILSGQAIRNTRMYMLELTSDPLELQDDVTDIINGENLKFGGYFAKPPIDVNI